MSVKLIHTLLASIFLLPEASAQQAQQPGVKVRKQSPPAMFGP